MIPPLPNSTPAGRTPPVAMRARRCLRHGEREAAARCSGCAEFFCRECVSEHEGRVWCAPCLAGKIAALKRASDRRRPWRGVAASLAAVMIAWVALFALGVLLTKIPPKFHDATLWNDLGTSPR